MDIKDTGIIIKTIKFSETSLIIRWFTKHHGRISTIAKGALRPKSPFLGRLDLFLMNELLYLESLTSSLHLLKEVRLLKNYAQIGSNISIFDSVNRCIWLILQTTEEETPMPELYDDTVKYLDTISASGSVENCELWFQLKLLEYLGLSPGELLRPQIQQNQISLAVDQLLKSNCETAAQFAFTPDTYSKLKSILEQVWWNQLNKPLPKIT
jgi:DNA repair protein RecO (recombination protein O)